MYATVTKPLTFEEFLAWDDGSGRDFELLDGTLDSQEHAQAVLFLGLVVHTTAALLLILHLAPRHIDVYAVTLG